MAENQTPIVEWADGVPVSTRFADPYYSKESGLAEARYVFLEGNGLPERFTPGFHVAELGFGTGLNLAVTLAAWRVAGIEGRLAFTTFEAFPMSVVQMETALSAFPDCLDEMAPVLAALSSGATLVETPHLRFHFIAGDARQTLPAWDGRADAWYLDGFAPARNPELWEPDLMRAVARATAANGTFATYTAAGDVRRSLAQAGFEVERLPGYGRKRHMSVGRLV